MNYVVQIYNKGMDTEELVQWLEEGVSLEQAQFDLSPNQHPEEGTPVVGYRVAYTYTDPDTQETTYGAPLTHLRRDSMQQELISLKQFVTGPIENDAFLKSSVPIHNPRESDMGFYYFADQSMAEDYMRMIALGKVGKPHVESPITGESVIPDKWTGEHPGAGLNLTLLRVSGVADSYNEYMDIAALRREGLRMKDMHIDEHILSIPVEDIAALGECYRNIPDEELGPKSTLLKQWAQHW